MTLHNKSLPFSRNLPNTFTAIGSVSDPTVSAGFRRTSNCTLIFPPPVSPLAPGSHPSTALPPRFPVECWEGVFTLNFHLKRWPIRLLARNLCLIPHPCLRMRSTATDLFPGSGFPVFVRVDWTRTLTGFFLHRRRLLRQRQNPCVISIRFPAPYPLDWRFRLCS